MRKIPNYISSYIDESIERSIDRALERQRAIFNEDIDTKFEKFGKVIRMEFNADMDARFLEFYLRFNENMDIRIKGALNEFDSKLKTIAEYVDTKTTPDEVRRIIHEERGQ